MADGARLKKMTVALPASLVYKLRILARSKRVRFANAAVREAVEYDFRHADRESAEMISRW